jgi:hypothetical protein
VYLLNIAKRSVCDDDEIVSIPDISNESVSDISFHHSDCEISDAYAGESKSGTNDSDSITGVTGR